MTDAERAELRELCESATPGPWFWLKDSHTPLLRLCIQSAGGRIVGEARSEILSAEQERGNAAFIAAAREAVPALLDDRDRLAAENARLRAALTELVSGDRLMVETLDMPEEKADWLENAIDDGRKALERKEGP